MAISSATSINYLFSSTTTQSQAQLDSLASAALGRGIDYYQNGNYEKAISSFKRSASLAPFSDNSARAYDYTAKSYLALNNVDEAIKTYEEAIRIYPVRDDLRVALGDIYTRLDEHDKALAEYKLAVKFNKNSAQNRFSLGQSYLEAGLFSEAQEQLQAAVKMSPRSAYGYYGLAQAARSLGNYQEAIAQSEKAISLDRDFDQSYLELGYAYADMGNVEKAEEQLDILLAKESPSAFALQNYMSLVAKPKIWNAVGQDGFKTFFGPGTRLDIMAWDMAVDVEEADRSRLVSLNVVFSKEMDIDSIKNPYNWTITRASITQNGAFYNSGVPVPSTEVYIMPSPEYITYNEETNTASVKFRLLQNDAGNATIDPSHIFFKFYGIDTYGKAMDSSADEYSGFSGVA